MKGMCFFLAGFVLLILVPSAGYGDGYCRNRATYYAPTYKTYTPYVAPNYAATYTAPNYDYTPVYRETYLKSVPCPTNPDYYSSSNDYYRDKVLLDAFEGKLSAALKKDREQAEYQSLKEEVLSLRRQLLYGNGNGGGQPQYQQPPPQQYQPQAPPEQAPQQQRMPRANGALPAVPEGLQAIVTTSCVRCHGATNATAGGGIDLSNLAAVPREIRTSAALAVADGHMPKSGKPLDDRSAGLFHQYATGRSGMVTTK